MFKTLTTYFKNLVNTKKFWSFLLFLLIAIVGAVFANQYSVYLGKFAFVLFIIALSFLTIITWTMAALAVFRSLFVAGAGLSLLLYIATEYCNVPSIDRIADSALINLLNLGILFVGVVFTVSLYKELFGDPEAKSKWLQMGALQIFKESNQGKHSWLVLSFYALSMGVILGELFQVLYPIFSHLCVYGG